MGGRRESGPATVDCGELGDAPDLVPTGIGFARSAVVLQIDPLAPRTPRLPHRRSWSLTPFAASTALHVVFVLVAASLAATLAPGIDARGSEPITNLQQPDLRHLVFLVSELPPAAGGGGSVAPIDRARCEADGPGSAPDPAVGLEAASTAQGEPSPHRA